MNAASDPRRPSIAGSPRRFKPPRHFRTLTRCCAFAAAVSLLVPLGPWPWATMIVPASSPFVALATMIATRSVGPTAMIGLPFVLLVLARRRWFCRWLCPMGLLTECAGRMSPVTPQRCQRVPPIGKAVALVSVAAACVGYPLLLCPLGAAQDLLALPGKLLFRRKTAVLCTDVAPICTDAKGGQGIPLPRRSMLVVAAGTVCAGLGASLGWIGRTKAGYRAKSALRPPGAVASWQFPQLCLRCGNCMHACPAEIIRPDRAPDTLADWLAPTVVIETDYCREDCNACMRVCPSGAIIQGDIEEKRSAPIGLAYINMDRCIMSLGPECRVMCMESCPYEAIGLHEWTWEDERRYPIVDSTKCPGCGACVLACTPMNAIAIRPPLNGPNL